MADSFIISILISLWSAIVRWYDASIIARAINGVCDFFKKRASGSCIVRGFLHGFCTGGWWRASLIYKGLSKLLSGRNTRTEYKSVIVDTMLNIFNIPLRSIGMIMLDVAAGMGIAMGLCGNFSGIIHVCVLMCIAVVGVILLLMPQSAGELYSGSKLLVTIGDFFLSQDSVPAVRLNFRVHPAAVAFSALVGAVMGAFDPVLPIVAAVAVLGTAAIIARYEIGVYMILLLVAFMPTSVMAGLGALTVLGFICALWSGRVKNLRPSAFAPLILMYITFGAFSTATSFHKYSSAYIFAVYIVFICAYVVMVNTFNTPAKWKGAVVSFVAGAVLIALYGIIQNYTMDATTQGWVDSGMFDDIKTRVYATFDNPNVLGQYLIVVMPLLFALFVSARKLLQKGVYLVMFALCFACLIFTWSRGAWVGVMLGVVVFLLLKDRRWIMLGILALLAMPFILPQSIMNRLLSIGNMGDSSTAYRVSVWIASARMAADFWMSGVGFGSNAFASAYSNYALNGAGYALHAHNFYIQFVADVGIGGLLTYLLMMATAYREIAVVKSDNVYVRNVTLAAAGVLAGYLFQGVAESLWFNMRMSLIFWILIALIVSAAGLNRTVSEI